MIAAQSYTIWSRCSYKKQVNKRFPDLTVGPIASVKGLISNLNL